MSRAAMVVLVLLFAPAAAFAGEIYGSLREGGAPKANVAYTVLDAGDRPA